MSQEPFPLDAEAIRELARLLEETGLAEIEVEDAGRKLRVARGPDSMTSVPLPRAAVHPPQTAAANPSETTQEAVGEGAVRSPMVGTAYLAAEPGATSFVTVGDEVSEGATLLIVEAMKVMNPILAPHGGVVTQILVSDGRPVEYGQILMVIDPAHV